MQERYNTEYAVSLPSSDQTMTIVVDLQPLKHARFVCLLNALHTKHSDPALDLELIMKYWPLHAYRNPRLTKGRGELPVTFDHMVSEYGVNGSRYIRIGIRRMPRSELKGIQMRLISTFSEYQILNLMTTRVLNINALYTGNHNPNAKRNQILFPNMLYIIASNSVV